MGTQRNGVERREATENEIRAEITESVEEVEEPTPKQIIDYLANQHGEADIPDDS